MGNIITDEEAAQKILKSGYEVKAVKLFKGHDGYGYNANLYFNGRKIASIVDDNWGGDLMFNEISKKDMDSLNKFAESMTLESEYFEDGLQCNADIVVDKLVKNKIENQTLKRKCKNKTLVVLKDYKEGEFLEYSCPFNDRVEKQIKEEHGEELKEIINLRFSS